MLSVPEQPPPGRGGSAVGGAAAGQSVAHQSPNGATRLVLEHPPPLHAGRHGALPPRLSNRAGGKSGGAAAATRCRS